MYLEGFISIKAAIKANNRVVHSVMISNKKRTKKTSYMKHLCESMNINVTFVSPEVIDQHTVGHTHGGFLAEVSSRKTISVQQLLKHSIYYYITGVEDPYNLGSIIRTIYSAGAHGVLLDNRDWSFAESTLSKSSAGAYEYIDLALVENSDVLKQIKSLGYRIVLVDQSDSATDLYDTQIEKPVVVVIGGEKRGISSEVVEQADQTVFIPYGRTFGYSLPATIAATVVSYELFRRGR